MEKYCAKCGYHFTKEASFCPVCGTRAAAKTASSADNVTSQPARSVPSPQSRQIANGQKERRSKSPALTALIVVLAVVIAIEGVIAGVWYPGFFNPQKRGSGKASLTEENFYNGEISAEGTGFSDLLEDFNTTSATNDIRLRYTDKQIADAPVEKASITTEGGAVTAGGVTATFTDYQIGEDCELVVKDLPTLEDDRGEEQTGISIKAYDVSLSSGQHEFTNEVELDIPRTASDAECGSVIWFNEEMNRWENIYSEVSEDGKFYHVYTTHFTEYAEKKYTFDVGTLTVRELSSDKELDLGVFTREVLSSDVVIDEQLLWGMANLKQREDVDRIGDIIIQLNNYEKSEGQYETQAASAQTRGNAASALFGLKGNVGSVLDLLKSTGKAANLFKFLGKSCTVGDAVLTLMKILYETKANGMSSGYCKAFVQSVEDHALDIGSGVLGILSLIPKFASVSPYLFVASLALYGYSLYSTYLRTKEPWLEEDFSKPDGFYRNYVKGEIVSFDGVRPRYVGLEKDYRVVSLDAIEGMSDEEAQRFKSILKQLRQKRYKNDEETACLEVYFDEDWVDVFKAMMWSCDDPADFAQYVETLFYQVAGGYWKLDRNSMNEYLSFWSKTHDSGIEPALKGEKLNGSERAKKTKEMVEFFKQKYLPLIKDTASTLLHEVTTNFLEEMDRMVKYLNTFMVFYVNDESAGNFQDSKYCVDFMDLKKNSDIYNEMNTERYQGKTPTGKNMNDMLLPVRFHGVTETLFRAINPGTMPGYADSDGRHHEINYYPYDIDWAPRIAYKGKAEYTAADYVRPVKAKAPDRVFCCRVYDYLSMGAPKQMDFFDTSDADKNSPKCETVDMAFPDRINPGKVIKVTATIGGDHSLDPFLGTWEGTQDILPNSAKQDTDWSEEGVTSKPRKVRITLSVGEQGKLRYEFTSTDPGGTEFKSYNEDSREVDSEKSGDWLGYSLEGSTLYIRKSTVSSGNADIPYSYSYKLTRGGGMKLTTIEKHSWAPEDKTKYWVQEPLEYYEASGTLSKVK